MAVALANLVIDRFASTSVAVVVFEWYGTTPNSGFTLYGDPDQLNVLNEHSVLD